MSVSRIALAFSCFVALLVTAGCGGAGTGGEPASGGPPAGPVNAAPTVSDIADQSVDEDSVSGPIAVKIGDAETPVSALGIRAKSSNTNVLPDAGIEIVGDGADRTLILVPAAGQSGTATVTVEVTDADGAIAATDFEVAVNALFRGEFSAWMRDVALAPDAFDAPIGALHEDGTPLADVEDIPRIKFSDDSAEEAGAYDDLLPAEGDPPPDD